MISRLHLCTNRLHHCTNRLHHCSSREKQFMDLYCQLGEIESDKVNLLTSSLPRLEENSLPNESKVTQLDNDLIESMLSYYAQK